MAFENTPVEALLGIEIVRPVSPLALAYAVEGGLPLATLEHLAQFMAPDDPKFKFRLFPKSTLERRRKSNGRLTTAEGNRLVRLAKVISFALQIYGTPEKVREFLRRPHAMLDGKSPFDVVLATNPGADLVISLLGRGAYSGGV